MAYKYPKSARVRSRKQYQRMARGSSRLAGKFVLLDVSPNRNGAVRLGITAPRQYGIAVKRNRFKRIVREAFRLTRERLPKGVDLNVRPRALAAQAMMSDIMAELLSLLS